MDIAAIGAAPPPPDASCAVTVTPDGETGFAALVDEAAATDADSLDASLTDEGGGDDEEALASLGVTSLLSLDVPVETRAGVAIGGTGEIGDTDALVAATTPDLSIEAGAPGDGEQARASATADVKSTVASPVWSADVRTAARADVPAGWSAPVIEPAADRAGDRPMTGEETADAGAARGEAESPALTDSHVVQAMRSLRATTPSRADHAKAAPAIGVHYQPPAPQTDETAVHQAASQAAPETAPVNGRQDAADAPAPSQAARFARALERAAAMNHESAGASPTLAATEGGSGRPSSFDNGTAERDTRSFETPRRANGGVTFAVAAPTPFEVRTLARAVDASPAADTSAAPIPERDVVAQLVQSMRVQFRDGIGEAVVTLKPEHLGAVQVSLKIENGVITATVQAEVASVRHWLESQQDTLRSGLADQGLRLDRFVVEPDGERQTARDDAQPREQRRQQPRRRESTAMSDADHPAFEVTV